jgi:hypothetical protein
MLHYRPDSRQSESKGAKPSRAAFPRFAVALSRRLRKNQAALGNSAMGLTSIERACLTSPGPGRRFSIIGYWNV